MKYKESEFVELKSVLNDDMKTEVIAFLNSYLGGTIYVGVDDFGKVIDSNDTQRDLDESKIINWIRDEAIYPNCSEFVNIKRNEDGVLVISIMPGNNKPYYLKEKGPKPTGVYIRYGRNKSHASQEEITRMIMESSNIFYEEMISDIQELTFNTLKLKFEEKGLDFNEFKQVTSGFIKDNKYTNLAFIFSDQYDIETKIGVYQGLDRAVFKSKKEFNGSIIKQIDKTLEYYDLCNETRIVIDGSPMRKEYVSYHDKATREAILNCYRLLTNGYENYLFVFFYAFFIHKKLKKYQICIKLLCYSHTSLYMECELFQVHARIKEGELSSHPFFTSIIGFT